VRASVVGFDDVQIIFRGAFRVRVARLPRGSRAPLRRAAKQVGFRHRRDTGHPFGRGRRRRLHCARVRAPPSYGPPVFRQGSASISFSVLQPGARDQIAHGARHNLSPAFAPNGRFKSQIEASQRTARLRRRRSPKIRHRGSWPPDRGTGAPPCTRTFTAKRGRHHEDVRAATKRPIAPFTSRQNARACRPEAKPEPRP
jgi:hypothetical protein